MNWQLILVIMILAMIAFFAGLLILVRPQMVRAKTRWQAAPLLTAPIGVLGLINLADVAVGSIASSPPIAVVGMAFCLFGLWIAMTLAMALRSG